ncbi:MAG TPA: phosphotransferase [Gammaproteobacteria bacterium]|nr:phosphotransferase [Gammaproteobacteria bacterium]
MTPGADIAAARAALRRVVASDADVANATLEPLHGGLHRRSWLVTFADGRRCVLRAPVERSSALLDLTAEADAMMAAARAQLAPRVVAVAPYEGVLLTEYRAGPAWTPAVARRMANIPRLAATLRLLHTVATSLPVFAAERIARSYVDELGSAMAEPKFVRRAEDLLALARRYDATYAPTAFCHNDLVAANVLDDGKLSLVDFEYAVRATPLLDLANFAGMNGLGLAEQRLLLESYQRDTPTTAALAELATMVRMVRLLAWFWAELGAGRAADPVPHRALAAELDAALQ